MTIQKHAALKVPLNGIYGIYEPFFFTWVFRVLPLQRNTTHKNASQKSPKKIFIYCNCEPFFTV